MIIFIMIFEAAILASSCSIDAFTASFAYGSNKIKIPFLSNQIINLVCSCVLGVSLFAGTFVRQYLAPWVTTFICFMLLFILGIIKLFDSVTKAIIRKHSNLNKEFKFSIFNLKFILNLYADPEKADIDASKTISPAEAVFLAVSLSLDGLAVGFGAALGDVNAWVVFMSSFVTNTLAVLFGCYLGNKVANKMSFNLSWISGVILVGLAVMKLF